MEGSPPVYVCVVVCVLRFGFQPTQYPRYTGAYMHAYAPRSRHMVWSASQCCGSSRRVTSTTRHRPGVSAFLLLGGPSSSGVWGGWVEVRWSVISHACVKAANQTATLTPNQHPPSEDAGDDTSSTSRSPESVRAASKRFRRMSTRFADLGRGLCPCHARQRRAMSYGGGGCCCVVGCVYEPMRHGSSSSRWRWLIASKKSRPTHLQRLERRREARGLQLLLPRGRVGEERGG